VDGDTAYVASNDNSMTISNGITINGPIRVTGHDIWLLTLMLILIRRSASNADIIFKGQGYVFMETNVDFTTDGGDVILWSNTVNTSSGTANNEVDLRGTNNVSTSGGKIVLAGGLDTNSDGIPDGYSYRSYDDSIRAADLGASVSLNSGGGDIIIRGQGGGVGVGFSGAGTSVDSGTGTITIDGLGVSNFGVWFGGSVAINSNSTSATAINISGTSTNDYGVFADSGVSNLLIQSTSNTSDTGDIVITGTGPDIGIGFDNLTSGYKTQILTVKGDITLNGEGTGNRAIWTHTDAGLYLGQRANSTAINGITPVANISTGDITVNSVSGIVGYGAWVIKTGDASNVGGNVIIAADTDATNGGFIYLAEGLTINSFGGDVVLGGGDAEASGYALGTTYNSSYSGNGIRLDGAVVINTSGGAVDTGGDITLRAKGNSTNWGAVSNGYYKYGGSTDINSGTGKISIVGHSQSLANIAAVGFYVDGGTNHYFTSASPTSDAITITGDASSSTSSSSEGILLNNATRHEVVATGSGGGVTITSKAGTNDTQAMQINDPLYVLANGGDIILQVESGSTSARLYSDAGGTLFLGSTAAANTNYDVTSTTSNIYFRSSGSITYQALITAEPMVVILLLPLILIILDLEHSIFEGGLDVETNGGDITLGGGNTSGTSYAIGENDEGWNEGVRIDDKLNLVSGGGDILIQGKTSTRSVSTAGYGNAGVGIYGLDSNGTINSGTGTITINGINRTMQSSTSTGNKYDLVARSTLEVLAKDGPINITSIDEGSEEGIFWFGTSPYFCSRSGSPISESSSDILIQHDKLIWASNEPQIATTGKVSIKPFNEKFTNTTVETDWFGFNKNGQTMSGLTIGKPGNISNITHNTDDITVAGPVTFYGEDITVSANLSSTLSEADILIKASENITFSNNKSILTNGGDVIFWSDSDENDNGYIQYGGSGGQNIITNGGDVIMGGGAGTSFPTGFANGNSSAPGIEFPISTTRAIINTSKTGEIGGSIVLRGKTSGSWDGIYTQNIQFFGHNLELKGETSSATKYGVRLGSTNVYNGSNLSQIIDIENDLTITAINKAVSYSGNSLRTGVNPRIYADGNIIINSRGKLEYSSNQPFLNINPSKTLTINFDGTANFTTSLGDPSDGVSQGKLIIQSYENDSFSTSFDTSMWTFNDNLESLTLGKISNSSNITVSKNTNLSGPISIYGGDITLSNSVTASGTLLLQGSGATTQSAAVSATTLSLQGSGTFELTNSKIV
jgi:hypothetical protein